MPITLSVMKHCGRHCQAAAAGVWEHFQTLCEIPRPSKHEQALRDYLKGWAELRGLTSVVDAAGNLIVRKPATPGMENRVGVVLQGHLDMVCQANAGTEHDFSKTDPPGIARWLAGGRKHHAGGR
jgi:di/tripeptidase